HRRMTSTVMVRMMVTAGSFFLFSQNGQRFSRRVISSCSDGGCPPVRRDMLTLVAGVDLVVRRARWASTTDRGTTVGAALRSALSVGAGGHEAQSPWIAQS